MNHKKINLYIKKQRSFTVPMYLYNEVLKRTDLKTHADLLDYLNKTKPLICESFNPFLNSYNLSHFLHSYLIMYLLTNEVQKDLL